MLEPNLKSGGGGLRDVQAPGWVGVGAPRGRGAAPACIDGRGWDGGVGGAGGARVPPARAIPHRLRDARVAPARRAGRAPPGHRRPLRPAAAAGAGRGGRARRRGRRRRAGAQHWARRHAPSSGSPATSGPGCARAEAGPTTCGGREPRPRRRRRAPRRARRARSPTSTLDTVTRAAGCRGRGNAAVCPFERADAGAARTSSIDVEWDADARDAFIDLLRAGPRRDPGVRDPRPRRTARAAAPGVGARAGPAATQRLPPVHRRPALARGGGRVRGAARSRRPSAPASTARSPRAARARRAAARARCSTTSPRVGPATTRWWGSTSRAPSPPASALDDAGADDLGWVVRNHLLLADTATRRDLGDERTISAVRRRGRRPARATRCCTRSRSATPAPPVPRRGARARPRWCASCS